MRSDLTPAFIAAKNAAFRRPRQLLVFRFPEAGDVYLSDQPLGAADGLSHEYLPLVESWGELQDSAGNAADQEQSEIRQMSITLWNGGANPFSDYFLGEYPENVEVELYQWFAGLAETDAALLDRFVVQDPIEFDEASRLLNLDLVSMAVTLDAPCGSLLTREDWPYAFDGDVGRGIPLAFGSPGRIPTLQAVAPIILTLKGSVLATTMTLMIYEDLAAMNFPTTATVKIDEELIRVIRGTYTDRLLVVQRGYTSEAAEHLDKREVIQVIANHTFLLCEGPVAAIDNVQIDGYPAPSDIYTVRADLDPARIIFSETPWVKKYADATRFLQMQFDGIAASNTALQAANAFDAADLATAAIIKTGNSVLALLQDTVNRNRGEILRAYLAVEHWESGNFASDYAEVWVSGVGVVGRLSRPNPDDTIELDADVDVDHGHVHEIGGEHIHNFTQPTVNTAVSTTVATVNPEHTHETAESAGVEKEAAYTALPFIFNVINGGDESFNISGISGTAFSIYVNITFSGLEDITVSFGGYTFATGAGGGSIVGWFNIPSISAAGSLRIQFYRAAFFTPAVGLYTFHLKYREAVSIVAVRTAVSASAATSTSTSVANGAVNATGVVNVKNPDDVKALAADNRAVNINAQDNPSRTVVNLFDLTALVNFDWAWFTGREIRVTYVNAGDAKSIYILHAFFDVEYVPTEIVFSTEVTAEVTGISTLVRPDQVIQNLLTSKGGIDPSRLDSAAWATVASQYTSRGYRIDGLLDAGLTLRQAISKVCLQAHSRHFTSGGAFKLVLREGHPASKVVAAQPTQDSLQARSISVARQPMAEIANKIQLFYKRDWLTDASDASGYLDSITKSDTGSIARFGVKTQPDRYNFDLIRDADMASAVAAFYLSTDAWPSSFYTFLAYLDRFDLEKEDVLEVSAHWNQMAKVPMVVRAMDRIFGSGKNSSINLFRIVAENLYYILKKVSLADQVLILESLSIMITEIGEFAEDIHTLDELLIHLELNKEDTVLLADTFALVMDWRPEILEAVTALDQLHGDMDCLQADTVQTSDDLEFWSRYGFGSGAFGQVKFGGLTAWKQKSPDQVYAFMQLLVSMEALREDTVMVSDALLFNSGFGGWKSSGFGRSLFGK
ncbi:MAG: hypothetical protein PHZ02_07300 [Desulfocapsaceae bacterium]|nr:hypothetical protein [Desulfocapsaceae bacterium]